MKKFFPLLLLVLTIACVSCQPKNSYTITGTIAQADSGMVYLVKPAGRSVEVLDSALVTEKGKFKFETKVAGATELVALRYNENTFFAQFFLEPAKFKVSANADSLTMQHSVVEGSENTTVFNTYLAEMYKLSAELQKYNADYTAASVINNEEKKEEIRVNAEASQEKFVSFSKDFIKEHRNSVVATFILQTQLLSRLSFAELTEAVNQLEGNAITNNPYFEQLTKALEEKKALEEAKAAVAIGKEAPNFTLTTPDGKEVSLSDFRGKYVLLDFWASWCGPCRKENPNVVKAYQQFKNKNFAILAVSLDSDKAKWEEAIKKDGLTWTHVSDLQAWQNTAAKLYAIRSIPASFLIDPNGVIVAHDLRGEALFEQLNTLLK